MTAATTAKTRPRKTTRTVGPRSLPGGRRVMSTSRARPVHAATARVCRPQGCLGTAVSESSELEIAVSQSSDPELNDDGSTRSPTSPSTRGPGPTRCASEEEEDGTTSSGPPASSKCSRWTRTGYADDRRSTAREVPRASASAASRRAPVDARAARSQGAHAQRARAGAQALQTPPSSVVGSSSATTTCGRSARPRTQVARECDFIERTSESSLGPRSSTSAAASGSRRSS